MTTGVWKVTEKKQTVKELKEEIKKLNNHIMLLSDINKTHREIINKDSCLTKLKKDEPIFTLRAQDRFAPMLIRLWADMTATQSNRQKKAENAYLIAQVFDDWARTNKSQFPD